MQGLTTFETPDTAAVNYPGFHSPSHLPHYAVPSAVWFGFIHGNLNRFCIGLEHTLAQIDDHLSWEQTQMAIICSRGL
jgi:hypothetical protein